MSRNISVILSILIACVSLQAENTDFDALYSRYKDTESSSLQRLGRACLERQHTDSAIAIFTILAKRCEGSPHTSDRKYAIEARLGLGVIHFINANYAAAYSNFLTASELEGKPDSPGHMNLAAIYLYFGDRNRAYRCLKNVLDASIASGNHYMASTAVLNILSADIDSTFAPRDSIASIIDTFRRKVPYTSDNLMWPLTDHMATAKRYSLDGQPLKAIEELRKAVPKASATLQPKRNHFTIFIAIGRNFFKIGQMDSTEYYIRKAVDIASEYGYQELLISGYADLSKFYEATGRKQLADQYKYKHLELHDSIFNPRELGHIHDLELFHEADKFEKRINMLKLEEKMRVRLLVVVSIAALLMLVLLTLLYRQNRKLQSKNKSLFDKNIEMMKAEKTVCPATRNTHDPSPIADETRRSIMQKINEAMADESLFCRDGFSLQDLVEFCGSNQKYVSRVLNEDFGKSFNQLLNEHRISVAKQRFLDTDNYGHLTIEAIVRELGFKSRSTFSKTFKKITGLSPSEFQRLATDKDYRDTQEQENHQDLK